MSTSRRWVHGPDYLANADGTVKLLHPNVTAAGWLDDMKQWPELQEKDLINYFILSEGVDGNEIQNWKSTEAYNYLHSGKIGIVLCRKEGDFTFLKAEVEPSQSVNKAKHKAWVLTEANVIQTVGCSCIAGKGRSCSHAAAIIWKVGYVVECGVPCYSYTPLFL